MPDVVGEAITAGILQGFDKDLNGKLGGPWLDPKSTKLEQALTHYFKKHPERGFKLRNVKDPCPCGYRKVQAMVYDPGLIFGYDYHFARQQPNGTWTEKYRGKNAKQCPAQRQAWFHGAYCIKIPE